MKARFAILIGIVMFGSCKLNAQTLNVLFTSGLSEYYQVSDIRSMSSAIDNIRLDFNNGNTLIWNASEIKKMTHETLITDAPEVTTEFGINVFPNPSSGQVNIEVNVGNKRLPAFIDIRNVSGSLVKRISCSSLINGIARVNWYCEDNMGNLVPNGNYICVVQTASGTISQKLIVQK